MLFLLKMVHLFHSIRKLTQFYKPGWIRVNFVVKSMSSLFIFLSLKKPLSTSNRAFPYYQGESTIFDKGNFLYQTSDTENLCYQFL